MEITMFADTLTVTINAVAKVLNRINQDKYSSEYLLRGATDEFRLKIRNSTYVDKARAGKVIHRHNVEFIQVTFPVAPATVPTIRKAYTVLENEYTDDATAALNFDVGYVAFLSSANITKLINFES
jgi:hypothetical protein